MPFLETAWNVSSKMWSEFTTARAHSRTTLLSRRHLVVAWVRGGRVQRESMAPSHTSKQLSQAKYYPQIKFASQYIVHINSSAITSKEYRVPQIRHFKGSGTRIDHFPLCLGLFMLCSPLWTLPLLLELYLLIFCMCEWVLEIEPRSSDLEASSLYALKDLTTCPYKCYFRIGKNVE